MIMDLLGFLLLGFVDGLNICSLSLFALLLSLLYSTKAQRGTIVLLGFVYIASVYLSYFFAGLGILVFSLSLPEIPHLFARLSVVMMLFFGAGNILNYFHPGLVVMSLPLTLGKKAVQSMKALTVPSLFLAGLLVGLHNFPCACTGGVYFSFISLVAGSSLGLVYLVLYNMMFVLPLLVILYVCSSKPLILKLRRWQIEHANKMKLVLGITMVSVSLIILFLISSGLR